MPVTSSHKWGAIFGAPDPERVTGRQKLCKVCGGWHRVDAWPHNCMEPQWRPPQHLAAPMIMADVPEHYAEPGVLINSRSDQREYMRRTGNVELEHFDETAGTHVQQKVIGSREYEADLVQDIKRALEEDPLNRPPPKMIEQANDEVDSAEEAVSMEGVEIVSDDRT